MQQYNSTIHFPLPSATKGRYVKAAQKSGQKLVPWILQTLDAAAADVRTPNNGDAWNWRLRRISASLLLRHDELARACTLGGRETTRSEVRTWLASPQSTKTGVHGQILSKHRPMPADAFDALLAGLAPMLDERQDAGSSADA